MAADGEPGAQVFCAASDRGQAGIVFDEAAHMAEASPLLRDYIIAKKSTKHLHLPPNSFLRAVSADAFRQEGLNAHGIVFDELHAQPNRKLWDTLRWSGKSRRQPLLIAITTAGWDRNSICYQQHERAEKVLAGESRDDTFFAYIAAAAPEDDWRDPATWRRANPSMGITLSERGFESECIEAQESPPALNAWKRYALNVWTSLETTFFEMESWDRCAAPVDVESLRGRPCYAGLDLSSTTDTTAFVLYFPQDGGAILPYIWVPGERVEDLENRDGVPFRVWEQEGHLTLTESKTVDYRFVRAKIKELGETFRIEEIAFDPYNATQIVTELGGEDGFEMVKFRQGTLSMNGPAKELETKIINGEVRHGGHPVLRWMAESTAVVPDAQDNIRFDKSRSNGRIDGIIALTMAVGRASQAATVGESIYKKRGLFKL